MIADMFGDRDETEQRALVGVVQECMGAALIDKKPRALSKACVFWGIQNRAKSGLLDVVTGLFGGNPISAGIGAIEGTHGLMPFQRRVPWILHEAFGGQWHFSSMVKAIITQEPVTINVKNGPVLSRIVRAPIFWATNFQPQFKESTRAIVDRMIVIEVTRAFVESQPIGAAAEAIKRGFSKPGEFVIATELPGVLNWAMAGLRRALERGSIELTSGIKKTADAIHRDSNLVAGFLDECIGYDRNARLRTTDFCLAHSAWFLEMKGEDRRLPSNDSIGKALRAIGDPRIGMDVEEMRDNTSRFYCGIALNKARAPVSPHGVPEPAV
ncbi:phage/plasmid-associated DNA primase [Bradyrhizobium sp. GM0.4]